MSKIKLRWLLIIAGIELAAMLALLVWGLVIRQPEKPPVEAPTTAKQNVTPTYKTPKVELAPIVAGFKEPTVVTAMPDAKDKRLFVVEQAGLIRVVNADRTIDATPFLDIKSKVMSGGEMGLLGLAFHPKVAENGYFFVNYIDKNRNTIIARYTISKQTGAVDKASEKIFLKVKQPYENHNGGQLAFGRDGYLYIGMGDGGSNGDPENRAQSMDQFLGKMLRVDVDKGDSYAIPATNPFVSGARPEIWALGLRNPWRFSFDRQTGDLYIADVGQGNYEEIDVQKADSKGGENYGWRCYEGAQAFKADSCQDVSAYTKPVLQYDHGDGRCSITGGYVYRGSKYPALAGQYFYGDYCNGQLFYSQQTQAGWTPVLGADTDVAISTFGEDSAGELYVADYASGTLYQITDTAN